MGSLAIGAKENFNRVLFAGPHIANGN